MFVRSTKAGVQTPATPLKQSFLGAWQLRRSTKAGVQTPATPLIIILARKLNSQAGLSWKFGYKIQNDLENSRHKDEIP